MRAMQPESSTPWKRRQAGGSSGPPSKCIGIWGRGLAATAILPIHQMQLLSYLRLSGYRVGLLLNFQASLMKEGMLRVLYQPP
jgi:hypothetical protein